MSCCYCGPASNCSSSARCHPSCNGRLPAHAQSSSADLQTEPNVQDRNSYSHAPNCRGCSMGASTVEYCNTHVEPITHPTYGSNIRTINCSSCEEQFASPQSLVEPMKAQDLPTGCHMPSKPWALCMGPFFAVALLFERVHTYTYIHLHTHVHIRTCIHIYTYTYVYLYTCIHIDIYTCTQIHITTNTHIRMNIYTYIHIYICAYVHKYIFTYMHIYRYTYMHIYLDTYIHIYLHAYMHTYIYTHIHIYIYTSIHINIYPYIHMYTYM